MQNKIRTSLFAAACCLASTVSADEVNMNPGLWEWTAKITMPNSPVKIPDSVNRKCLTKKDMVPATKKPGQECDIKDLKTSSDQVSWAMTCKSPQGPVASTGKMFYQGDTAHGEVEVNTQGMLMTSKMTGKRLGDCKE
jgi:hypothetical protein